MNKRPLLLALLLGITVHTMACGPCFWTPQEYFTYRLTIPYRSYDISSASSFERANCLYWAQQTSRSLSTDAIYQVVYKWGADRLRQLKTSSNTDNEFAQWISQHDQEAVDFLILAKENEQTRFAINDPWYYPYEGDPESTKLYEIAERAKTGMKGKYHDRYALQLVRAYKTLKKDYEIIDFWNTTTIHNGVMRGLIRNYVVGAYYTTEQYEKALRLAGQSGDVFTIHACMNKLGDPIDEWGVLDMLAAYPENDEQIKQKIEDRMRSLEDGAYCWEKKFRNDHYLDDVRKEYDDFIKIAHKYAAISKTVKMRAVWKYTEAYLYWLENKVKKADQCLAQAEQMEADEGVSQSIHVLRMLIDMRQLPVDKAYYDKLLAYSQWFVDRSRVAVPDLYAKLRDDDKYWRFIGDYHSNGKWVVDSLPTQLRLDYYEGFSCYRHENMSLEYYSDMLRKMAIGYAAPRLMEQGDSVHALQLVMMADNVRIPQYAVRYMDRHSDATFAYSDIMSANTLMAFVQHMEHPQDALDRFCLKEGGFHKNFWYDIVGTHCLREARYGDAIPWLEQVPRSYSAQLNVYAYFYRDPFEHKHVNAPGHYDGSVKRIRKRSDYKLRFAQRMVELSNYPNEPDPDKRASMELEYAIGMHNSVYPCWALTQYYQGQWMIANYFDNNLEETLPKTLQKRARKLMKEALATYRSREKKAEALWSIGEINRAVKYYENTRFVKKKRAQCDKWAMW